MILTQTYRQEYWDKIQVTDDIELLKINIKKRRQDPHSARLQEVYALITVKTLSEQES